MNKKLLVIPLCLMLLLIPASFNIVKEETGTDAPQPFFENGIYYDPITPEIKVSPLNYSTSVTTLTSTTYPLFTPGLQDRQGDGIITRYVVMAYDEGFLSHSYETPSGVWDAWQYARDRTWKAFIWFYALFYGLHDVRLQICGEVTWHSDSRTDEGMFYEAIEETGFYRGKCYNGYSADALIAWTTELEWYGGLASQELATAMINYQGYPWDDNVCQHELSHVFNATDGTWEAYMNGLNPCYYEECIMSYRTEYVEKWVEDGQTYRVYTNLPEGYLTHIYCDSCMETIQRYLLNYYRWLWYEENPWLWYGGNPRAGDC